MGDRPLEPLSLLVVDTTPAPRSRHRYRPGRPVPSAEHGNVVPDVPPTPRRAVSGACGWRETPCQRHVSPHNPIRFETTVDTPPPAAISPHAATSQAGPNRVGIMSARSIDTTRTSSQSHRPTPSPRDNGWYIPSGALAAGDRWVGQQSPPPAPPNPDPLTPAVPTARHRLRLGCPGAFSPVISRGNANNPICHTPGASRRAGVRRSSGRHRTVGSCRDHQLESLMASHPGQCEPVSPVSRQALLLTIRRTNGETLPSQRGEARDCPGETWARDGSDEQLGALPWCRRCEGLRLEGLRQGRPVGYRSGRFDLRWPEEGWAGSLSPGELSELAAGLCLTRESAIAPVGRGLAAPHDSRVVRPKPVRRRRRHVGRFALFGPTASSPVEDFARVVRPNILAPFGAGPAKGAQERQVPVVRGVAEPGVENGPNGTALRCFFRTLGGGPGSGPVRADVYWPATVISDGGPS